MTTTMMDCPYCEKRAESIDGVCPDCKGNLNDEAAVQRHILKQKALAIAKAARAQCASYGKIEIPLTQFKPE